MTELDDAGFIRIADETLKRLAERLEDELGDVADVDLREGVLTVELDDGRSFVVNKHAPNRQIWLASPKSGASHYLWDGERWIGTRDGAALTDVLRADLGAPTGD